MMDYFGFVGYLFSRRGILVPLMELFFLQDSFKMSEDTEKLHYKLLHISIRSWRDNLYFYVGYSNPITTLHDF
jgi:hypothetical protein